MLDNVGLIKQLEDYMQFIPEGGTGALLRSCYKMIKHQGAELEELKQVNTALAGSERMYIERLKVADAKIKPRKRVKK